MKLRSLLPSRPSGRTHPAPFRERAHRLGLRLLFFVGFIGVAAGLFALGIRADRFVRKSDFFVIDEVAVRGASPGLEQQIRNLVGQIKEEGDTNLLLLSAGETKSRVEGLPRVRSASVHKELPKTLKIDVVERRPLIAGLAGDFYWLDEEGFLLDTATAKEVAEAGIPVLTGLRGSPFKLGKRLDQPRLTETLEAVRFLKERDPELGAQFSEWNINSQNEIVGILKQGVEVRFGATDPLERFAALEAVLQKKKNLRDYTYLDLRFDSQAVCK